MVAAIVFLTSVWFTAPASAIQLYAQNTGKPCSHCHTRAGLSTGKMRLFTSAGEFYRINKVLPGGAPPPAVARPTCPSGYTMSGNQCARTVYTTPSCPRGFFFDAGQCLQSTATPPTPPVTPPTPPARRLCRYSGERGYDSPSGSTCRASYTLRARERRNGSITFDSDGRSWTWNRRGRGWRLQRVSPPTKYGTSGRMNRAGRRDIEGTFKSGFCGNEQVVATSAVERR